MNKKISTARRGTIIFLSLLTVLVISLLIYGYDRMHDPEKVKAHLYACGKMVIGTCSLISSIYIMAE